jgi:hypothetical protein
MAYCRDCGAELKLRQEGDTFKAIDPCPYPEGQPPFGGMIEIPTGTILFGDEMFCERPEDLEPDGRLHAVPWERSATEKAANINVGHGYCGNSCPGVYVSKDRKEILVANTGYDSETDEELPSFPGYRKVGSVCTDLWWWTIVDESVAAAKAVELGTATREQDATAVQPGLWKVSQQGHLEDRDDLSTSTVYARLTWVSPLED